MELENILEHIYPPDHSAIAACRRHWDQVAKPLGSLGKLEDLLCRIAGISGTANIQIGKKYIFRRCAEFLTC